jgi:hypothetical protein
MLARILERSRQVLELFRELRRVTSAERPLPFVIAPPPRVATRPQHLHATERVLGG